MSTPEERRARALASLGITVEPEPTPESVKAPEPEPVKAEPVAVATPRTFIDDAAERAAIVIQMHAQGNLPVDIAKTMNLHPNTVGTIIRNAKRTVSSSRPETTLIDDEIYALLTRMATRGIDDTATRKLIILCGKRLRASGYQPRMLSLSGKS